nr:unnamed protein product [Spirometra erinaceieuropaei]
MREQAIWMHSLSRRWRQLDFGLVRKRDQRNVLVTKAIQGANGKRPEELPAADENAFVETRGCRLRDVIHLTAQTVLSRVRRPHQDRSEGNYAAISNLLGERNSLHRAYFDRSTDADKVAFYQYRHLAQQRWRKIQDSWIAHKAKEIQGYAYLNESANFFIAIKAVCGLPTVPSPATIDRLSRAKVNINLDLLPPLPGTIRAVQQLSTGNAFGSGAITAQT